MSNWIWTEFISDKFIILRNYIIILLDSNKQIVIVIVILYSGTI